MNAIEEKEYELMKKYFYLFSDEKKKFDEWKEARENWKKKDREINDPLDNSKPKEDWTGFWIPYHNAKVMKRGIEENNAPFLPDSWGTIKTEAIYNAASGYCLPACRLIPCQFQKNEYGFKGNIVAPRSTINYLGCKIKENEKCVFFNYKDEEGEVHAGSLFFAEQLEDPEPLLNYAKEHVQENKSLSDVSFVIASSEPKEFLGSYIAACRTGMKLSTSPETAEAFKAKMLPYLENEIKDEDKKDKTMPKLSWILFDAEKRSTEIIRTLTAARG